MKSIRIKILLSVIGILCLTGYFQSFFSFTQAENSMHTSVDETLNIVASKADEQIRDLNQRYLSMIRAIAHLPFYSNPDVTIQEKCSELIILAMEDHDTYINVAYYDNEGYTIYGDGSKVNFADMDYVKRALRGEEVVTDPLIWNVNDMEGRTEDGSTIEDDSGTLVMVIYAVPVYHEEKIIGTIVALVNGSSLEDIVSNIDMGDGHHPAILARATGDIFGYAPNREESYINLKELYKSAEFAEIQKDILNGGKKRITMNYPETKIPTIIDYHPIEDTPWSLIVAVPYKYYFGHLAMLFRFSIMSLCLSIIVAMIILIPIIHAIVKPLKIVSSSIDEIASGNADLTKRIVVKSKDEVGTVVKGFNNFTDKLQTILSNIKKSQVDLEETGLAVDSSTQDTSASISEIIENIDNVHKQITTQNQSVQQTASAVNEIAANIASLEHLIDNQANSVTGASAAVEEMIGNIESVNTSVDKMAESFDKLLLETHNGSAKQEDVSNKIEQIAAQSEMLQEANQVISSIAEQTNLLAMNAAIEAAHAGEAGRGFSVVADEIRKLSETSTAQSKTIGNQLSSITESITQVVTASNESNKAFISVSTAIKQIDEIVRLIKSAMEEQRIGSQQINTALGEMNNSTAEVKTASHEMAEGNKQILDEVKNLQDSTLVMKQSMEDMAVGAEKISFTGTGLSEISAKLKESIIKIGDEVKLFNV